MDDGPWSEFSTDSSATLGQPSGLADGAHTFYVKASDEENNTDPSPAERSFSVDATGPDASITAGPSSTAINNAPSFAFSSPEQDANFECRLDNDAFAPCTSQAEYANLANGSHTFHVRAVDALDNAGTPASRTWKVDTALPNSTIVAGPSGAVRSTSVNFSFTSEGSSFVCSLDGAAFSECYSPRSYFRLDDGRHTFRVKATDVPGNATPAERTWRVDTADPSGRIAIDGGAASTPSRAVTLSLRASDPAPASGVAYVRLKNNGGEWSAWKPYAASKDWFLSSGAGTKTVYSQYKDRAGNVSAAASDSITFRP